MAKHEDITAEFVRQLLDYDPETGILRWKKRDAKFFKTNRVYMSWNTRYAHTVAGQSNSSGRILVRINSESYCAHRLIWLMVTGKWPENLIDHVNGCPGDNRISNLRAATHAQNNQNKVKRKSNKSGFIGVSWASNTGKWMACIGHNYKRFNLGHFKTPEEAYAAYCEAKKRLHSFNSVARE